MEYGVGGYGLQAFAIREFLDVLSDRKMAIMNLAEDVADTESGRKFVATTTKTVLVKKPVPRK